MQGAGCGLLGQGEKLRNIDIYVDVVCIPFTLRQSGIIADELQVDFIQVKAVVLDLHKTALGILTDDLPPVVWGGCSVILLHAIPPLLLFQAWTRLSPPRLHSALGTSHTACSAFPPPAQIAA